jgi:hypothetical protein
MRSVSHTCLNGMRTLKASAAPPGDQPSVRLEPLTFAPRNHRRPLWLKVVYVGGSEGFWEIETRGRKVRRGSLSCLGDLLQHVNGR